MWVIWHEDDQEKMGEDVGHRVGSCYAFMPDCFWNLFLEGGNIHIRRNWDWTHI